SGWPIPWWRNDRPPDVKIRRESGDATTSTENQLDDGTALARKGPGSIGGPHETLVCKRRDLGASGLYIHRGWSGARRRRCPDRPGLPGRHRGRGLLL